MKRRGHFEEQLEEDLETNLFGHGGTFDDADDIAERLLGRGRAFGGGRTRRMGGGHHRLLMRDDGGRRAKPTITLYGGDRFAGRAFRSGGSGGKSTWTIPKKLVPLASVLLDFARA